MSERSEPRAVLRTPLEGALRDPVTEGQLHRIWRNVEARRSRPGSPFRAGLVGAVVGATLAVAAMLVVNAARQPAHPSPVATMPVTAGALSLASGAPMREADLSTTATPKTVALSDGSHIEVPANVRLEPLASSATEVVLRLARGRAIFDIVPGGPRRWTIEAGLASVEVVGTRFAVTREPDLVRVNVERGVVLVRGATVPDGVSRIEAGGSIEVHAATEAPLASAEAELAESPGSHSHGPARAPWRESAAHGRYDEAYVALGSGGVERETSRAATVEDLLALADVARLSGHPAEAVEPLGRLLREHPSSTSAPLAALTLGRIQLSLGRPRDAAHALERALSLRVPGGLEEDLYARLVEAYAKAGDRGAAASAAREYQARFPGGRRTADVLHWTTP